MQVVARETRENTRVLREILEATRDGATDFGVADAVGEAMQFAEGA